MAPARCVGRNLAGLGDNLVIHLELIDTDTGAHLRHATESLTGESAALIRAMREVAVQLVAPERFVGTIEMRAAQSGVEVTVDGLPVGERPLADPRVRLPVGTHAVEATGPGYVSFSAMVQVEYGETVALSIDLPPSSVFVGGGTPHRHRWWTWTIGGAGVIALGIGSFFNIQQADYAQQITARVRNGTMSADRHGLYASEATSWDAAIVAYCVGAWLAGIAATFLALDLFPSEPAPAAPSR